MPRPHPHPAAGFSLPEVLIASMIVAIISLALAQAIVAGHQQTDNAVTVHRAAALADSMLERVLALPYDDPEGETTVGPDSGESGYTLFDNVDDYHNYTEAAGALIDASGTAWPNDYQDHSRSVRVVSETLDVADLGGTHDGMTVTVTVTMPDGRLLTVRRWVPSEVSS
ncbi:MAG: prepilin-type N-terminal cleavage/methylation domain-containing protein [Planctomycetota bacterium]